MNKMTKINDVSLRAHVDDNGRICCFVYGCFEYGADHYQIEYLGEEIKVFLCLKHAITLDAYKLGERGKWIDT